jgi:heterodisulfide reductase subunit B
MAALGAELSDISEWTCCGASAAESSDHLLARVLPAVNLARAASMVESGDILIPCSACYLNMKKAEQAIVGDDLAKKLINEILAVESLACTGRHRPRHILDILAVDIGPEMMKTFVKRDLSGITAAPYYGCQCLRPYAEFDDPEAPVSMEPLLRAAGAKVHRWSMGGKCCGASHMTTHMEVGEVLVYRILSAAKGADVIVTVCPMCQMNLEGFQQKLSARYRTDLEISVLYLPQLLGAAMGIAPGELGLSGNLALLPALRKRLHA